MVASIGVTLDRTVYFSWILSINQSSNSPIPGQTVWEWPLASLHKWTASIILRSFQFMHISSSSTVSCRNLFSSITCPNFRYSLLFSSRNRITSSTSFGCGMGSGSPLSNIRLSPLMVAPNNPCLSVHPPGAVQPTKLPHHLSVRVPSLIFRVLLDPEYPVAGRNVVVKHLLDSSPGEEEASDAVPRHHDAHAPHIEMEGAGIGPPGERVVDEHHVALQALVPVGRLHEDIRQLLVSLSLTAFTCDTWAQTTPIRFGISGVRVDPSHAQARRRMRLWAIPTIVSASSYTLATIQVNILIMHSNLLQRPSVCGHD